MLKVTIIQSFLHWEDIEANLEMFTRKIENIEGETDLIVLPEMFSTGFSMNPKNLAESPNGPTFQWMKDQAKKRAAAITGSVIIKEKGKYYNRMFFVYPEGTFKKYDKRHTFTYAGENEFYTRGTERLVLDYKGWKICPLVCYDLRFPVWARNSDDYDILIYIANWPKVRTLSWETLLRARAIENMCYCIGVNRVGSDGENHEYIGQSAVFDAVGEQISSPKEGEFIQTVTLEKASLEEKRMRFQFLNDRDSFEISIQ